MTMTNCVRPGCGGTIQDGFCDECGLAPAAPAATETVPAHNGRSVPAAHSGTLARTGTAAGSTRSARHSRRGSSRSSSRSTRTARSSRGRLGAGLVSIPQVPYRDPATAVMADPQVPEHERFCSNCGQRVGRGREGAPGRTEGFCRQCGTAYSFTPKLAAGDLVAGQYEVLGCLAHGGLGWIYLARDRNVSDRWVVLKGLLDTGDADAMAAAVAERQFLATVEHPNIVKIFNFVKHPDPRTREPVGYIVMEYVGGASLKELRSQRDSGGGLAPLPLAQGLAYILEILPAMGYLHGMDLLYCDFKPDNMIQTEEQLKLIDLGAVRQLDDEDCAGFKTDGYCAPELETEGASVESDLFTVARTLAVLTFNFDYRGTYRYTLPPATEVPLLARFPSFRRLLERATAADPGERFGSASEMAEQVTGVLREVVATEDGQPRPALSTVFSGERAAFGSEPRQWPIGPAPADIVAGLPVPMVDPADPAAGFLATTAIGDPRLLVTALEAAPVASPEVTLALVRARIESGDTGTALTELAALEQSEDADWRITWFRGLAALVSGDFGSARTHFDTVYGMLPGEAAAKLALAAAREGAGEHDAAARLYLQVWRTDHGYPSAAFGLARTRLQERDIDGAIAAAESVPASSSHHTAAQLAALGAQLAGGADRHGYLVAAGERLSGLALDPEAKAWRSIAVLDAARTLATAQPVETAATVLGYHFTDRDLRCALESQFRTLARLAPDKPTRRDLVNRANAIRPVSWI
ncbi:serine/threonine-protein kinase [Nocardia seriolae]|uniref:serine/threonine-protein kinase n=1 Tax=Nocardia seriolae TaxID=37332 RepID=UPI0009094C0C|nr:serine/threonine-protein kinase [Nocardia seriolae]WKY55224.1 tetratricopeptide repeat protein [Nocardia seriolae]BAW07845.1 serine/threonine protein kinase [Nocardia seriolae]BEK89256.1 serine/threonine-protein kinase [Nocardia seriolae]